MERKIRKKIGKKQTDLDVLKKVKSPGSHPYPSQFKVWKPWKSERRKCVRYILWCSSGRLPASLKRLSSLVFRTSRWDWILGHQNQAFRKSGPRPVSLRRACLGKARTFWPKGMGITQVLKAGIAEVLKQGKCRVRGSSNQRPP